MTDNLFFSRGNDWGAFISEQKHPLWAPASPLIPNPNSASGYSVGPSTHLHAGAGPVWPAQQSTEDAFEAPRRPDPFDWIDTPADQQYSAEFRSDGGAVLVLKTTKDIAKFDTFEDAQEAAKALNQYKGY
jgi:hypothetical protein